MGEASVTASLACAVCRHAVGGNGWGQSGTHCQRCHRSWTGLREIHCVGCCAHFSTVANLDLHKTRAGACIPPGEVVGKDGEAKLRTKAGPNGLTWVSAHARQNARIGSEGVAENRWDGDPR